MSEKKLYPLELDDQTKLVFALSIENNALVIEAEGIDNKSLKYKATFLKRNLDRINKIFKMDKKIDDNLLILIWCFEEKKVSLQKIDDLLILTFSPKIFYMRDFYLSLKEIAIKEYFGIDLEETINEGKKVIEEQINKCLSEIKNLFG